MLSAARLHIKVLHIVLSALSHMTQVLLLSSPIVPQQRWSSDDRWEACVCHADWALGSAAC